MKFVPVVQTTNELISVVRADSTRPGRLPVPATTLPQLNRRHQVGCGIQLLLVRHISSASVDVTRNRYREVHSIEMVHLTEDYHASSASPARSSVEP
eukprot:SAG31_NODE_11246_length_1050_cov_1.344900_1_plen_96_part_10